MDPLRRDPVMADLVETHGDLSIETAEHAFERLVVAIVYQFLSVESAGAIAERVRGRFDGPITPEAVLAVDDAELVDAGLGATKTEYAKDAARAFLERDLESELPHLPDAAVVEELSRIRGIGEWTARMYLIFVLGREDVFPVGDLAVRRAMTDLHGDLSREEMVEKAAAWSPRRTDATLHLWQHYLGEDVDLNEVLP